MGFFDDVMNAAGDIQQAAQDFGNQVANAINVSAEEIAEQVVGVAVAAAQEANLQDTYKQEIQQQLDSMQERWQPTPSDIQISQRAVEAMKKGPDSTSSNSYVKKQMQNLQAAKHDLGTDLEIIKQVDRGLAEAILKTTTLLAAIDPSNDGHKRDMKEAMKGLESHYKKAMQARGQLGTKVDNVNKLAAKADKVVNGGTKQEIVNQFKGLRDQVKSKGKKADAKVQQQAKRGMRNK